MNRSLNNQKKGGNIGCIGALLGTLAVVLCTVVYSVISSLIANAVISARFKGEAACALLTLSFTAIAVSFVLYEIVFICFELARAKKDDKDGAGTKKMFRIVLPVCIFASLLFSVVSANTYTELNDDSIKKVCFVAYKKYSWEDGSDVMRYTLACSAEGQLTYTVTMKDGEKIEILNSVNSCSDEFKEKYENLYGYAAHLTESFESSDYIIEGKIIGEEYMSNIYKNDPKIWTHIEKIIDHGG